MAYATISDVRLLSGLTVDEISDTDLSSLIDYADRKVLQEITIPRIQEDLKPNLKGEFIDGINKVFYLQHSPIADINRDSSVTVDDIKVYAWTDSQDEGTKSLVTVSSIEPETGRVELASAPSTEIKKLTADYSFYLGNTPDWSLLKAVSSYFTAYLAMVKLKGKTPVKYSLGRLRVTDEVSGGKFLREALRLLHQLRNQMAVKTKGREENGTQRS